MKVCRFGVGLAAVCLFVGCGKKEDVIIAAADRVNVTAADIDRDPVALMPSGAVGLMRIDAPALFRSAVGQRLRDLVLARMPLPPSAGFEPTRDLTAVYVGLYSMSGANVAAVATGTFNPAAIERAADGTTMTPLGAPLVKTTYARQTLYVSRNIGFAVLTEHTVLLGDETGIRRALDRLGEGRAAHDVPPWVDDVLRTPNAAMVGAFNLQGQAPVAAGVKNLAFLHGLKTARIVGNFEPPGMNFAGTLTYPDPQAAQAASADLEQTNQKLRTYSFFLQLAGIGNPIQKLQTSPSGNDTQFVVAVEQRALEWALTELANQMGVAASTTPIPATVGPMQSGGPR
jgi:hypothetical protein